jgi:DNA-binding transcriptional regulator YiaG
MIDPREIAETRRRLGLSKAALAKRLGVAQRTVRRWEAGQRPSSLGARILRHFVLQHRDRA